MASSWSWVTRTVVTSISSCSGELRGVAVGESFELYQLEQLVDAFADIRLFAFADLHTEGDVVEDGHVFEGRVVLEDEPDPTLLRRHPGLLLFEDKDLTAILLIQAGDRAEQGRFAGP
jgi:hypothetical protein